MKKKGSYCLGNLIFLELLFLLIENKLYTVSLIFFIRKNRSLKGMIVKEKMTRKIWNAIYIFNHMLIFRLQFSAITEHNVEYQNRLQRHITRYQTVKLRNFSTKLWKTERLSDRSVEVVRYVQDN